MLPQQGLGERVGGEQVGDGGEPDGQSLAYAGVDEQVDEPACAGPAFVGDVVGVGVFRGRFVDVVPWVGVEVGGWSGGGGVVFGFRVFFFIYFFF